MTPSQVLAIKQEILILEEKLLSLINQNTMTPNEEKLYTVAKLNLGKHLTLNEAVPDEVGCCECVSKLLSLIDISTGSEGIEGTPGMYEFLDTSALFEKVDSPEQGCIIIYVTDTGNGSVEGHVLICGAFNVAYKNDWGLMSNESSSGLLEEQWSWTRAQAYYQNVGGLVPHIFALK